MYKIVKIKYRSVMVNDEEKNSVDYYVNGTIHSDSKYEHIHFTNKEGINFEISFNQNDLVLKQGNSVLNLNTEHNVSNCYQTPYGAFLFDTKLLLLERKDNVLKIKYELYQNKECVSKIYMQIAYFECA